MSEGVAALTGAPRIRLLNQLLRHVDIVLDATGCWEWRGSRVWNGYGKLTVGGKTRPAHRVMYELAKGPIPDGLDLDHLCRNRACIKPAHLEPVTRSENIRRGVYPASGNALKTHCPKGHPYDEANTILERARAGIRRRCRICRDAEWRTRRRGSDCGD